MKKLLLSLLTVTLLAGCTANNDMTTQPQSIDKNAPITRGQAVKMLALSRYSDEEISALPRVVSLSDSDISNWCDKYINAAVTAGLISGTQENTFLQNDPLSLEQADFILKKAAPDKNLVLQYAREDRKKPVSSDIWFQAFDAIDDKTVDKEIVILADSNLCSDLSDNYVLSSEGLLCRDGVDIPREYIGCGLKVCMRDKNILAVKEVTDKSPIIKNAVVETIFDDGIIFNIKGCHIFYGCAPDSLGAKEGNTMDIKTENGRIISIAA